MHLCDCSFGVFDFFVENVGYATVHVDYRFSVNLVAQRCFDIALTGWVYRKFDVLDGSVSAKDLAQVAFVDILGQLLDHDLGLD